MAISSNFIVHVPHTRTVKETLLENKQLLLFGSAILVGLSLGMPIGAFIYNQITNAAFASCPQLQETHSSWLWETTTLTK